MQPPGAQETITLQSSWGDNEAAELAAYNYVQAMGKFGEETQSQEEQWRKLHETLAI